MSNNRNNLKPAALAVATAFTMIQPADVKPGVDGLAAILRNMADAATNGFWPVLVAWARSSQLKTVEAYDAMVKSAFGAVGEEVGKVAERTFGAYRSLLRTSVQRELVAQWTESTSKADAEKLRAEWITQENIRRVAANEKPLQVGRPKRAPKAPKAPTAEGDTSKVPNTPEPNSETASVLTPIQHAARLYAEACATVPPSELADFVRYDMSRFQNRLKAWHAMDSEAKAALLEAISEKPQPATAMEG